MRLVKYFLIFQLLVAGYTIFKFLTTPLEEKISIQLSVYYLLITYAIFGLIYMTKIMAEDWYKLLRNKET